MSFWEDVVRVVQSGEVSAVDAKVGLGTLGLMHEVLNPGQRAPAPIDKMVDDLLLALLGERPTSSAEESANRVAALVADVIAHNPILKRFGTALARQWDEAEARRTLASRNTLGTARPDSIPVGSTKVPGAVSPLAARISQLKK